MKALKFAPALLAGALLAALPAAAQTDAAKHKELADAQAELQRAAKRLAELTGEIRLDEDGIVLSRKIAQELRNRPVIGVVLAPDETVGVRIGGVTPNSAAAKAGLKAGDRIVRVDGSEILGNTPQLRMDNARRLLGKLEKDKPVKIGYARDGHVATASVTPEIGANVFAFNTDGAPLDFARIIEIEPGKDGLLRFGADVEALGKRMEALDREMPNIERIMRRVGPGDCKSDDCLPVGDRLSEAFRWSGLNLASVDPQLGRYFGTDKGVLVVSSGDELAGLQAGDVIQRIDGKPVATPREAMAALRAKPADSSIDVEFLRDRKTQRASIKAPKAVPFRFAVPPAPPAPPAPPSAPKAGAVPTPPAPPAPPVVHSERRVVTIGKDGKRHEWTDDGDDALPPPAPPAPPGAG